MSRVSVMPSKVEVRPYFNADLKLAGRPHLQFNRMLSDEVPKRIVCGKLMSNYLLQGLSEFQQTTNASALVLAQTQPEDEILIQRFWPLDSVIRIYPCSYNLFIDQIFKSSSDQQIISFLSNQSPYDDPFWQQADQQIVLNTEQFVRKLSLQPSASMLDEGFAPVLIEEAPGKTRILNQHEWAFKNWQKQLSIQAKKKKEISNLRPQSGWSTGVIAFQKDKSEALWHASIVRYEISHAEHPVAFLEAVAEVFTSRLTQLGFMPESLGELLISTVSSQASQLLSETFIKASSTVVLLPDQIYGWNPVASCLRVLASKQKLSAGILIDKAPFVDVVVAHHAV